MIFIHLIQPEGCYGIIPRYREGIRGILLAPLFHSTWKHLFNNLAPIFVLSFIVFNFYHRLAYLLLILGWMATGILVWLFADLGVFPSDQYIGCHIGASGLVYLLASFVFFSGWFRRSLQLIAVSFIIVFLYGSMIWGIFPEEIIRYTTEQSRISWESHLFGALVGLFFAYVWRKIGPQRRVWEWQKKGYYNEQDEELWQKYLERFPEEEQEEIKKKRWKDLF